MLHEPSIDQLAANIGSKYALCVVASKRARQIFEQEQRPDSFAIVEDKKPLSVAADEIYDGKIVAVKD
jgi:DNA-directed RNA polymerase omega subunit